ncbi:hypothetical protein BD289DRAFT_459598 [Coniella lustricola]|uniref:UmuC domain-containing protein n=1 Tax=Coniella lustricola TaxID=2025994 RepID=A0A2T3ADS4_9PEZI|nr:hypothetical protein BD289DRAFT_459598 [Coniella lustricola]
MAPRLREEEDTLRLAPHDEDGNMWPKALCAHRIKVLTFFISQDYDCFYAQVVENARPALKSLPLGIKQKSILATCNYVARRRGVRKLQPISDAKKLCPDLVLADGEDLSAFRDVSKRLHAMLRSYSWNHKVERLGLDEIFIDVTDIVAYNVPLLNRNALSSSFFCLSQTDPEQGFSFDASAVAGCVVGPALEGNNSTECENPLHVRLLLASHLARYLRLKIEEEGYTSACGISTNKLLSKLVGSVNKPRNQTTLLSFQHEDALSFLDPHGLRKVPGIGGKIAHALESFYLGRHADTDTYTNGSAVTVADFRRRPDVSAALLERLLGARIGSERGVGDKIWALLHGVDDAEVKAASNVPTQISIEDTYPGPQGGLRTFVEIEREMTKLAASLLRRLHVDLTEEVEETQGDGAATAQADDLIPLEADTACSKRRKWLAHPKTIRLSTRPKTSYSDGKPYNWGRASRSQPLPTFIFSRSSSSLNDTALVARLVKETLLPMFLALNPDKGGWNIGMINICVANIIPTAGDPGAAGCGRDISQMFRKQEDVLREFRVHDDDDHDGKNAASQVDQGSSPRSSDHNAAPVSDNSRECQYSTEITDDEPEGWGDLEGSLSCQYCGHMIPPFAVAAHERYHEFEDG